MLNAKVHPTCRLRAGPQSLWHELEPATGLWAAGQARWSRPSSLVAAAEVRYRGLLGVYLGSSKSTETTESTVGAV